MRTPIVEGRSIEQFIPKHLRRMFYNHAVPEYKYAIHNGYDPYGFTTDGLVLYLPFWALKGSPFNSVDAYGHTCTVTAAAAWGLQGRTWDGANSLLIVPDHAALQNIFDGGGSICVSINPTSDGEANAGQIFSKYTGGVSGYYIHNRNELAGVEDLKFVYAFTGVDGEWTTRNREVTIGAWNDAVLTYDSDNIANVPIIYVDALPVIVDTFAAPTGARNSDVGDNVTIGNDSLQTRTFDGVIGEVRIYNRVLTQADITHNFNCTKWRYP